MRRLLLCCGALFCALAGSAHSSGPPVARTNEQSTKGGVLVKDGKQTACQLAVIDSRAAVVAAACIDLDGSGRASPGTKYKVFLDDGIDGKTAQYDVEKVTPHPKYNNQTFINNLAVLQFNSGGGDDVTWQVPIAVVPEYNWSKIVISRRWLADMDAMEWASGDRGIVGPYSDDNQCGAMSYTYLYHKSEMACYRDTLPTPSADLTPCPIPYGASFGVRDGLVYHLGLHGYTVLQGGTNLCSYTLQSSYFTLLSRYIGFIQATLGRNVDYGKDKFGTPLGAIDPGLAMLDSVTPDTLPGVRIAGDFFGKVVVSGPQSQPSGTSNSATATDASDTGTSDSGNHSTSTSGGGGGKGGLSRKTAVIVGVCVAVGGFLLLATAAFLALRWWRRRLRRIGPDYRLHLQDTLAVDASQGPPPASALPAIIEYDLPPIYDEGPAQPWSRDPPSGAAADYKRDTKT